MLSNNTLMLISVLGVTFGVLGTILGITPYLKRKNVNVDGALKELNSKGELVQAAVDEIKPLLSTPAQNIINVIERWAPIAAGSAEQLYHSGDIGKDDRAGVAESVVLNALKELKIEVDDNKKTLIDATIKNAVNDFGHKTPAEAEKAAQLAKIQEENSKLTQENQVLNQKLSNIAAQTAIK